MSESPPKPPLSLTGPSAEAYERVSAQISPQDSMFQGNADHYFSCGASALNAISAAVGLSGMAQVGSILDFGSGAGRVTRWLRAGYPSADLTVTDIREGDLAFCGTEFAATAWVSTIAVEELSAPRHYDLIWMGSVVTHLSEDASTRLIRKLLSFLTPRGLLVLSTHGRFAHSNGPKAHNYGVEDRWSGIVQDYLGPAGYGYADYPRYTEYGISLAKPSWMARLVEAMPNHRLVLFSERAWDGHHDVAAIQNMLVSNNVDKTGHATPKLALCAIMKNEGSSVLEWIAYHLVIGFDQITIYDNQSTDNTGPLCQSLAAAGVIKYLRWPDPAPGSPSGPQIYAYQHASLSVQADWLCFLDADEFLVLETANTVAELIASAGQAGMPIALNWRMFGSGGAIEASAGLVIDRFTRCGNVEREANQVIKTIGPVSALRHGAQVHIHGWLLDSSQHYVDAAGQAVEVDRCNFVRPPRWRQAWVNHYIVKSRQEFEMKHLRGSATETADSDNKFSKSYKNYFLPYDCNEEEDHTIQRFRPALLAKLNLLQSIIKKA